MDDMATFTRSSSYSTSTLLQERCTIIQTHEPPGRTSLLMSAQRPGIVPVVSIRQEIVRKFGTLFWMQFQRAVQTRHGELICRIQSTTAVTLNLDFTMVIRGAWLGVRNPEFHS